MYNLIYNIFENYLTHVKSKHKINNNISYYKHINTRLYLVFAHGEILA